MTKREAERIRRKTGLSKYNFSLALGFSYATYWTAITRKERKNLSRGLELAIKERFGHLVEPKEVVA